MWPPDHRGLDEMLMPRQDLLDLARVDIAAAADDHVLRATCRVKSPSELSEEERALMALIDRRRVQRLMRPHGAGGDLPAPEHEPAGVAAQSRSVFA
jgi:hypothetical protein